MMHLSSEISIIPDLDALVWSADLERRLDLFSWAGILMRERRVPLGRVHVRRGVALSGSSLEFFLLSSAVQAFCLLLGSMWGSFCMDPRIAALSRGERLLRFRLRI